MLNTTPHAAPDWQQADLAARDAVDRGTTPPSPLPPGVGVQTLEDGSVEIRTRYASVQSQPGKRQRITSFTRASHRRMQAALARLRWQRHQTSALVLTWPGGTLPTIADYTRLRRKLLRRIKDLGGTTIMWKLEFQKRGAPHLNLVLQGVPCRPVIDWWLAANPGTHRKAQWSAPLKSASTFVRYMGDSARKNLDHYQHKTPEPWKTAFKNDPRLSGVRWWWVNPAFKAPPHVNKSAPPAHLLAARPADYPSDAAWKQVWPVLQTRAGQEKIITRALHRMLRSGNGRIYGPLLPNAP
ncbi:MAG: hypothetical protein OXM01_04575 [Gemmatimonadota bacterium]|nr:hypothetical protein [Gemmatimonadota bacterium]